MKQSRLVFATVVVAALCTWGLVALACDKGKTSASAAAAHGSCTAEMAAQCTPEMAAACAAKGTKATTAAMNGSCAAHGMKATTAGMNGSCAETGAKATTAAMNDACCEKGAKGAKGVSAMAAGANCGTHGTTSAKTMSKAGDCDACADLAMCADDAKSLGANVSVVPLKNGVMYVYTAEQAGRVQAVQAEMTRRSDHIAAVMAAGDKAKLCPECKLLRGAIASGKLSRELVNIEGGCLTLMTSTDPAMVAKLHALAGVKGQMKLAKS